MRTERHTRRTRRGRRCTARLRGGGRAATSVVSAIAAEASHGTAENARKTEDPFYDLQARLVDEKSISKKTEYIMRGNTDDVLSAYDKMVAKTQARMAEYVHKLSADLAGERDPKVRAKLEDDISSVLVAVKATRSKFRAERTRLKAAVRAMRADPKMKKQAASILTTGVKMAIAVFGVAAISYAGYHYGPRLWGSRDTEGRSTASSGDAAFREGSRRIESTKLATRALTGSDSATMVRPDHLSRRLEMKRAAERKADLADNAYVRTAVFDDIEATRKKYTVNPSQSYLKWWTNPEFSQRDLDERRLLGKSAGWWDGQFWNPPRAGFPRE